MRIRAFHPLAETTAVGSHNAFQNCRRGERILYCRNCFAQLSSEQDQEEGGSGGMSVALWVGGSRWDVSACVGGSCWDATVVCGSLRRNAECTRRPSCPLGGSGRWNTTGRCVGDTNGRWHATFEHR